jgi:hypothetical protein
MPGGIQTAEECGARRTAVGRGTIGVGERHALLGEVVQIWCDRRVPRQDGIRALMIGHHNENIGLFHNVLYSFREQLIRKDGYPEKLFITTKIQGHKEKTKLLFKKVRVFHY